MPDSLKLDSLLYREIHFPRIANKVKRLGQVFDDKIWSHKMSYISLTFIAQYKYIIWFKYVI